MQIDVEMVFIEAVQLLFTGNDLVLLNLVNALEVAGYVFVAALVIGLPLGALFGIHDFPGKRVLRLLLHIWLFIPALGIGIFFYYLEHNSMISPVGFLIWGTILMIPTISAIIADLFTWRDKNTILNVVSLGATRLQLYITLLREKREGLFGAITIGLARITTEIATFFLVLSFLYSQEFPSKPATSVPSSTGLLAVAIGIFLFSSFIYFGFHFVQFKKG
jgi:ABC-type tungstate transport system substrate-binding protein